MTKEGSAKQLQKDPIKGTIGNSSHHSKEDDPKLYHTKTKEQIEEGPVVVAAKIKEPSALTSSKSPGTNGPSSMACCTESSHLPSLLNMNIETPDVMSLTSIGAKNSNSMTAAESSSIAPLTSATDSKKTARSTFIANKDQQGSISNAGRKRSRSSTSRIDATHQKDSTNIHILDGEIDDRGQNNDNQASPKKQKVGKEPKERSAIHPRCLESSRKSQIFIQDQLRGPQEKETTQEQNRLSTEQINALIDNINIPTTNQIAIPQALQTTEESASRKDSMNALTTAQNFLVENSKEASQAPQSHPQTPIQTTSQSQTMQIKATSMQQKAIYPELPTSSSQVVASNNTSSSTPTKSASAKPSPQSKVSKPTSTSGRWSSGEHQAFLEGLNIHGREWKKVAQGIPTRTSAQIRSHAQKYFAKLARDEEQKANLWLNADHNLDPSLCRGSAYGMLSARIGMEGDRLLTPSVLERAKKILKDPTAAELEVEETLARLRNRYHELQQKLRERQNSKIAAAAAAAAARNPNNNMFRNQMKEAPNIPRLNQQNPHPIIKKLPQNSHAMPMTAYAHLQNRTKVEPTRIPTTHRLRKDSLASKELIALHVLGGELYRSGSKENLIADNENDSNKLDEPNVPSNDNDSKEDKNTIYGNDKNGLDTKTKSNR